jgi:hypothetical protein
MLVVRPAWFPRSGVLLGTVTVMALPGTFLTVGAGEALRNALHLNGGFGPAALIARHAHAGMLLRDLMVLFTGAVIVVLFAQGRGGHGQRRGLARRTGAPPRRADPAPRRARGPGRALRLLRVPHRRPGRESRLAGPAVGRRAGAVAAGPCSSCSAPVAVRGLAPLDIPGAKRPGVRARPWGRDRAGRHGCRAEPAPWTLPKAAPQTDRWYD